MRHFLNRRILITPILLVIIGACGVPDSGQISEFQTKELPFDLGRVVATTTTSTPTATTAPDNGTDVQLYFLFGQSLIGVTHTTVKEPSPTQVLAELLAGPQATGTLQSIRTALPSDLNLRVNVEKGVAKVATSSKLLTGVAAVEQTLAIGQIVLTLTSLPGIGQVSFSVDGRPQAIPRGGGDLTAPGALVTFDDYKSLIAK